MMMSSSVSAYLAFAGQLSNDTKVVDLNPFANNGLITGVKVFWANAIVGFEFVFGGQSAGLIKAQNNPGVWEEVFNLVQGDYIVDIFGRHSAVIDCIGFRTAKGLTKVWGNPTLGEAFNMHLDGHYLKAVKVGTNSSGFVNYVEPSFEDQMFIGAKVVQNNVNDRITATLGNKQNDSQEWNDLDWIAGRYNISISSIKIWHDNNYVIGFQCFYSMDGTTKSPGVHCFPSQGAQCVELKLQPGEYINKVFVRAGNLIDHITIFTSNGGRISAGGRGGNPFLFLAPPNHQFMSFGGANASYLHQFHGYYDEIY
jgi:hypothetical protein